MSVVSPFAGVPAAPPDPILGLTEAFNLDPNPRKVNLGVGVYQDETGKVPLLRCVRVAQERWNRVEETKNYIPIDGIPAYSVLARKLVLGEKSPVLVENRALTIQALGGTGALRVGADFLRRFLPDARVWISAPSWANHRGVFSAAGFDISTYPYYNAATHGLDADAMLEGLGEAAPGDVILLHACCHNPTGVDPEPEQWRAILDVCRSRQLVPFLDFAYQGLGLGLEEDAYGVRLFAESGLPCVIASSFSKSFSMYRERVGALTIVTASDEERARCLSQVKRVIRTNYSSPASHGAQVVATVLGDPDLVQTWRAELSEMKERIQSMRRLFVEGLASHGVSGDYSFIVRQRGMFSFSGLDVDTVRRLRAEKSLYIVDSGRICMAAMNRSNVGYICESIAEAIANR